MSNLTIHHIEGLSSRMMTPRTGTKLKEIQQDHSQITTMGDSKTKFIPNNYALPQTYRINNKCFNISPKKNIDFMTYEQKISKLEGEKNNLKLR